MTPRPIPTKAVVPWSMVEVLTWKWATKMRQMTEMNASQPEMLLERRTLGLAISGQISQT